jgi:hypothetical protein
MTTTAELVDQIRRTYKHDTINEAKLVDEISDAMLRLALACAGKHDKGSKPQDVVVLLRALTHLVAEQGTEMSMIMVAQLAGMCCINNGGMTYGCLSAEGPEGDPKLPLTVLVSCNRKHMPQEQIAEFILRESVGVQTERREN